MSDPDLTSLLRWTQLITGLEPEAVTAARAEIEDWRIPHLSAALLEHTLDAAVSARLLVVAVERLTAHGAERSKLLAKLRHDHDVWPTWTEIRVADLLVRMSNPDVTVTLEVRSAEGAPHADFRLTLPNAPLAQSVEVKAVGMSLFEVAFCERMGPSLDALMPREGIVTVHAPWDGAAPQIPRQQRREVQRRAMRAKRRAEHYPDGLTGISIVAHGSESSYVKRVASRFLESLRQLPEGDECWVAFHWSNGATVSELAAALPWADIPEHVVGIRLVGSAVAFPHPDIHHFQYLVPRGMDPNAELGVSSTLDDDFAGRVYDRFDRSSGVRAILLRGDGKEILRRNGRQHILPYNLLLDPDPELISGGRRRGTVRGARSHKSLAG